MSQEIGLVYRRALDTLLEGFQLVGFDWVYLYVNPAAARHGRKSRDQLEGRSMLEVYPGIEQTALFEVLKSCMTERRFASLENLFRFPDGEARWFELRIEPVPSGICIHSVDIHERKMAQEALEAINADLEAQVAARTRELELTNSELEAFSYSVSHDLRAPLRHIGGFASLLQRHLGASCDETAAGHLTKIIDASDRMGRLIDDLLALSRTGRAPVTKRPVALDALVNEARRELPEQAVAATTWDIQPLPQVEGDPALLRLALINLLSNAVKYTRGRPEPRIEIGARPDGQTRQVVVFVRDNGVGFEMKYVDKLFGVFQRLHSAAEFEGTGIGLANVRRIIHKHGGRVWAEGAVGQGATFFFTLPAHDL